MIIALGSVLQKVLNELVQAATSCVSAATWTYPQADLTGVSVHIFGVSAFIQQPSKILSQGARLFLNPQLAADGFVVFPLSSVVFSTSSELTGFFFLFFCVLSCILFFSCDGCYNGRSHKKYLNKSNVRKYT